MKKNKKIKDSTFVIGLLCISLFAAGFLGIYEITSNKIDTLITTTINNVDLQPACEGLEQGLGNLANFMAKLP